MIPTLRLLVICATLILIVVLLGRDGILIKKLERAEVMHFQPSILEPFTPKDS
jgi:hypothetical protein